MEFFETVARRGSYRGPFTDRPVPEEDVRKMLTAAIQAPSGYNLQTTSFLVVTDPALRQQLADLMPTPATKTASLFFVVVSEKVVYSNGLSFEVEDYAAATENLMLAITALGYAGVWMDGMTNKLNGNAEKLKAMLQLPEGKTVRTIIPVGVPAEEVKQREKKDLDERVVFLRG